MAYDVLRLHCFFTEVEAGLTPIHWDQPIDQLAGGDSCKSKEAGQVTDIEQDLKALGAERRRLGEQFAG
jgi:hypothetical protein